jgi:carbonic anhydrase
MSTILSVRVAAALLGLSLCAAAAQASDVHAPDPRNSPVKPMKDADADKPAAAKAAKARGFEDPMDRLRQRLAEKLGAQQAEANPDIVRVANRPGAASTTPVRSAAVQAGGSGGTAAALDAREPAEPRAIAARPSRSAVAAHGASPHWDYSGDGAPENWSKLKPEFSACSTGKRQSPIDIRDGISVQLDPVQFDYKPSSFKVLDNGHTVQVNVAPGNSIEVMGRRFELLQFHFHRPSEERINGRQFDMVAHLVHKDLEGKLAVVAVLLDRGSVQPLVQMVWNNLPLEKGDEVAARATLDLNALLPAERGYYTYMGSLTTPPCSEGVLWMVLKQPVGISPEQIGIFSRLYPMNARPIQSASGRLIKGSN